MIREHSWPVVPGQIITTTKGEKRLMNPEALSGKVLGTCTLQQLIGRGGMGAVFQAQQSRPRRQVAVKVFLPMTALSPNQRAEFLERFRRETDTVASLEHHNIMPVHEYGEQDGLAYLVMPYIAGGTLRDELERDGALPLPRVVYYLDQIAAALDFAHERGVIHRDVKPANILIAQDGRLLLTDFGLVKIATEGQDANSRLSEAGVPMGTPDYIAPEQVIGGEIDARADLYSLGVILYHMVTGSLPFKGKMAMQVALQHVHVPAPSPRTLRPDLPVATEQVILRAMAKQPADRYMHAQDLVSAFRLTLEAAGVPLGDTLGSTSILANANFASRPRGLFDPVWQANKRPSTNSQQGKDQADRAPAASAAPQGSKLLSRNDIIAKTSMTLPSFSGLLTEVIPAVPAAKEVQPAPAATPEASYTPLPPTSTMSGPASLLPANNGLLSGNPSIHTQMPGLQALQHQTASPAPAHLTPLPPTAAEGVQPPATPVNNMRLPSMRLPQGPKTSLFGLSSQGPAPRSSFSLLSGSASAQAQASSDPNPEQQPKQIAAASPSYHGLPVADTAQPAWEYSPISAASGQLKEERAAYDPGSAAPSLAEQPTGATAQPAPAYKVPNTPTPLPTFEQLVEAMGAKPAATQPFVGETAQGTPAASFSNAPTDQGMTQPQPSTNITRKLNTGPLSSNTSALLIPVGENNGSGNTSMMKLAQAAKIVKVPVAGQPGRYVTGLLPVLPSTPEPEPTPPFINKLTELQDKLKPHKKIVAVVAAVILILFSGIFMLTRPSDNQSDQTQVQATPDRAATATFQTNATAQANIILSDSLQANSHNWPVSSAGPQFYVFKGGAYHLSTNDTHPAIALLPDNNLPETFMYTLSFYEVKGDHASINNLFGMVIRFSSQQKNGRTATTFYCFEMLQIQDGGEYEFRKYDDSYGVNVYPWTRLWAQPFGSEYHFGQGAAKKNTVQISMNADKFTFTVNGKQLGQTEDNSLASGQIGMLVNQAGTEVAFSNLQLTYK